MPVTKLTEIIKHYGKGLTQDLLCVGETSINNYLSGRKPISRRVVKLIEIEWNDIQRQRRIFDRTTAKKG